MQMGSYPEAVRHLYGLTRFGVKLGLENTLRLAELVGEPHRRLRFIHVAGTNGKGTTCAMLESICRQAGMRVGLYTSPHLISFRERIQVGRELIPEDQVVRLVGELQTVCADMEEPLVPTFFEFVTVMAFRYFAEQECDVVVLETGMGGRFDSTNIVRPLVSVITPISLDHQAFLGDTLPKIAREKAGIIKPEIPVVTAPQEPEVMAVLQEHAAANCSRLVESRFNDEAAGDPNEPVARCVAEMLADRLGLSGEAIGAGLERWSWPGRFQRIEQPGRTVLLDGAHNPAGFRMLCERLPAAGMKRPVLILGLLGDKDASEIVKLLPENFSDVLIVPIASKRAGDTANLEESIRKAGGSFATCPDLSGAFVRAGSAPGVVVAGSFYLVGEALEWLGEVPVGVRSERELNEFGR